jgi:hypothetical protein
MGCFTFHRGDFMAYFTTSKMKRLLKISQHYYGFESGQYSNSGIKLEAGRLPQEEAARIAFENDSAIFRLTL